jgi:hypothetical protein
VNLSRMKQRCESMGGAQERSQLGRFEMENGVIVSHECLWRCNVHMNMFKTNALSRIIGYWGARWLQVRALPHAIKLTSTLAGQTDGNPRVAAPGNVLVHAASAMSAMLPPSSVLEEDATTSAHTGSIDRASNDSAA